MIYLGEQQLGLNWYAREAICWLAIKTKGRLTSRNSSGHNCKDSSCVYCTSHAKKRRGLDVHFSNLFTDRVIKALIISKPDKLTEVFNSLKSRYLLITGKTEKHFNDNCKSLFVDSGYTDWFLTNKKNYYLAKKLDQHTCTYCNREYIFIYENKAGGKGMVPQFDHWYSKTDYPLLALSFYNLIPSCATCNVIKSSTKFNLTDYLHPYKDKNISSSYSFSFLPTGVHSNKIIIKNNSFLNSKGLHTANALNIPMIYEGHSTRELQDLIDLKYKYSKNYLNILFKKTFGNLKISEQDKFRLIFGIELEVESLHKRPFSKFKKDILKELNII